MNSNYQSRWQQLAHRLMDDLLEHPDTNLPGIQGLAQKYKVSRPTVELALNHLEDLGIIASAERGKKRRINVRILQELALRKGMEPTNRILFISAVPDIEYVYHTHHTYKVLQQLCKQDGFFLSPVDGKNTPPSKLKALLTELSPRGVIIFGSIDPATKVVLSLGIPLIGLLVINPEFPCFYYADVRVSAFRRAFACGHSRVVSPVVDAAGDFYDWLASDLEKVFSEHSIAFNNHYNLPLIPSTSVEDFQAVLDDLFHYTPPTCLILDDLSHYLAASSFLQQRRLRIPDEVSVIIYAQDPLLVDIRPSIAHYTRLSDNELVQAYYVLKEQMKGLRSHEEVELEPTWVPGDSLAAPPPSL